jgi:Carboxypeptidase regulatory-like domain
MEIEQPVAGLELHVQRAQSSSNSFPQQETRTNELGLATLLDLEPGRYLVRAFGIEDTWALVESDSVTELVLNIDNGAGPANIRISDANGTWIAGAQVRVEGYVVAVSNAEGRAAWPCQSISEEFWVTASGFFAVGPLPTTRALGAELSMQVGEHARPLELKVVGTAGEPLSGIRVSVSDQRGPRDLGPSRFWQAFSTDAAGVVSLESYPKTPLRVATSDAYWAPHEVTLVDTQPAADSVWRETLVLKRGATVSGRVQDKSGAPIEAALIGLWPLMGRELRYVSSDSNGNYALSGLPGGSVRMTALHKSHGEIEGTLELSPDYAAVWDPVLPIAQGFRGVVLDASGRGLRDLKVVCCVDSKPNEWLSHCTSGANGEFELLGVKGGITVSIAAYDPQRSFSSPIGILRDLKVFGIQQVKLEVNPQQGASICAKVVGPDGAAVPGAQLSAMPHQGQPDGSRRGFSSALDQVGLLRIELVPPGTYEVSVQAADWGRRWLGTVEIGLDSNVDYGVIELAEPCVATIQLSGPGSEEMVGSVSLLDQNPSQSALGLRIRAASGKLVAGQWISPALQPGPFEVKVHLLDGRKIEREIQLVESCVVAISSD